MCYSAQVWEDYRKYVRSFDAAISIREFVRLYVQRKEGAKVKIPKGMDAAFTDPKSTDEQQILSLIQEFDSAQATKLEQDLFKQKKRLADAERTLQTKPTKKAAEDQRIATTKIEWSLGKLADLRRTEVRGRDSRIFPGHYAPVMVMENGQRVIKPMRYQCRPKGKPPKNDILYPGTYNARRDSLKKYWKGLYGYSHGIVVVNAFYENVSRHAMEGRELAPGEVEENVILEFKPTPTDMLVACLWSHWEGKDEPDLLSFAAITDEPPAEVAAAGHDRCIIPIKPENIEAWLNPDPADLSALYAILDDRERPFYEHRMAA
ncbi:MAG: SOS response-associated peptidase [Chloroflexota bacterium]|nr:SOS response-associated peptidase [Chloroflexota bacterium]